MRFDKRRRGRACWTASARGVKARPPGRQQNKPPFFAYRNRLRCMPAKNTRREAMGGLAKGLAVIRCFSRDTFALTLSEVAAATRMPAATARRCLLTLEE